MDDTKKVPMISLPNLRCSVNALPQCEAYVDEGAKDLGDTVFVPVIYIPEKGNVAPGSLNGLY